MNTHNTNTQVLIFEKPQVIPVIISLLNDIAEKVGGQFELVFATSAAEAEARLPHTDIAIIDVEDPGRSIAHKAVASGIPTIALSQLFRLSDFQAESDRLKLIAKPYFNVKKFEASVCGFVKMLAAEKDQIALSV
jgi:hypothetical protein